MPNDGIYTIKCNSDTIQNNIYKQENKTIIWTSNID